MENDSGKAAREAAEVAVVSPYLQRPLRTLQEVMRRRQEPAKPRGPRIEWPADSQSAG